LLERHPQLLVREEWTGDVVLDSERPPEIDRDMDRLRVVLRESSGRGARTLLLCDNQGQAQRLEEILGGPGSLPRGVQVALGSLAGGFILSSSEPPLTVLTDHEIFRRSRRLRRGRRFRGAVSLERLAQLKPGEYVVHMDHGIGRFRGLERVNVAGEELEALAVEYADGEILRVPTHRLDLVERWVGSSENAEPPAVHRIGGKRWERLRNKTEAAIEQMTAELLELYARRENADGFAFSRDTRWQKEMESSFLYEDTPDQRSATEEVKRDMETAMPMDRLICGDVGYGKTEVAIRAAFKAVQDSKQVAVLAPTTILVEQHRHTFEERLADYPVRIAALSRFRTRKEQEEILEDLASGEIDLVIGTHRILQEDVEFHDLGLLVVDEEQRFGVRHKEKLKRLRTAVDVLTLTATPIPRTLHLSVSGLRDLTLIRTPPRDRMPVITHVLRWNDRIVMEALERELDRGGQAFFLHNRVETIHSAAERVRRLVPEAAVDVAHGQMSAGELDEAMRAFVDGETDVLVCTSIIENGLDVPNANTLVVYRADRFGLSQLYQIRGRVGRSDRRAYCYLIIPEDITEDAQQRMKVLEHYTELGSGYEVALRDLELRGAGNLLGSDQSGFAHAVGLDTYMRLLEKTVERLNRGEDETAHPDPDVSLGGSGYLPDDYVADSGQKLHLYRRISKVRQGSEVEELRSELVDRYGPVPEQAARLLDAATLRILGRELGIQRVIVRKDEARLNFRGGVVPQMSLLQRPLENRQLRVEVRRMDPFSITVTPGGPEPLVETLIRALDVLVRRTADAAA
ncbi:MAG: transcription-repair coupling factor, partial [Gemmatimonadota bacterium]